jgi:[acyl-carrier-protein] S-malonyltransferase
MEFGRPATPVLFNVTAAEETDPDVIRAIMTRQIVSRVRWFEIINNMIDNGVNIFIEVGPHRFQIDNPESLVKCKKEIEALA